MLALAAGGCSSANYAQQPSWVAGPPPEPQVAAEARYRPDLEDDGMEAQVPPPPTIRSVPDDPSEPFSPNYGGGAATSPTAPQPKPASQPSPGQRAPVRSRLASATSG